jgi:2-keto-3-deoxy-L-rhamnonate aldolase RhmA
MIGTRILTSWPCVTELVGSSGNFDYIEYVAEYTPFDQHELENLCIAAELHGLASMIKVDFQNRHYIAQKSVASGFQAILFTDHKTPDEVRESIFNMKSDTPDSRGRFGYPNRRFIGYQPYVSQLEHAKRLDDTVLCFMIEKAEAMENIDEICSIPGVDMVQFGPSDYAMSRGWNAADHREECKAAERKMIESALAHGVQPRCEIYGDPDQVKYYIDLGVKYVCFGDQMNVYATFLNKDGKTMREYVDRIK